jgi:hypothetical protein
MAVWRVLPMVQSISIAKDAAGLEGVHASARPSVESQAADCSGLAGHTAVILGLFRQLTVLSIMQHQPCKVLWSCAGRPPLAWAVDVLDWTLCRRNHGSTRV